MGKLLSFEDYLARINRQIPGLTIDLTAWGLELMNATKELRRLVGELKDDEDEQHSVETG